VETAIALETLLDRLPALARRTAVSLPVTF
jgi:hypothetical protein